MIIVVIVDSVSLCSYIFIHQIDRIRKSICLSLDYEKINKRFSLLLMVKIYLLFVYVSNLSCIAGDSHPSHRERVHRWTHSGIFSMYYGSDFEVTQSNLNFRLSDSPVSIRFNSGVSVTMMSVFDSHAVSFHKQLEGYKVDPRVVVPTCINLKLIGGITSHLFC